MLRSLLAAMAAFALVPATSMAATHTVAPGETLWGIAYANNLPTSAVAAANGLSSEARVVAGTIIKLPTGAAINATTPAPARTIVPQAAPMASPGRLSAGQVGTLAAQSGAPSSLAAAIAWQESGFNNAMISPANARGIMQVMPGTWSYVQQNLANGRQLDPNSATDNVHAGVMYLKRLLADTGGDENAAIAGYYQGLGSVRPRPPTT